MAKGSRVPVRDTCRCGRKIETCKVLPNKQRVYNFECNRCRKDAQWELTDPLAIPIIGFPEPEHASPRGGSSAKRALHSGLRRDLSFDLRMRDMLVKLDYGGDNLTQIEYRYLLRFYGLLMRLSEIMGDRYLYRNALETHRQLVGLAERQGFSQGLLNMYGVMVEDVFARFC